MRSKFRKLHSRILLTTECSALLFILGFFCLNRWLTLLGIIGYFGMRIFDAWLLQSKEDLHEFNLCRWRWPR